MNIVILSHTFRPTMGGAEVGVHEIARRLGRHHNTIVVAPRQPPHAGSLPSAPTTYAIVSPPAQRVRHLRHFFERAAARIGLVHAAALLRVHWRLRKSGGVHVVNPHFIKRNVLTILVSHYLIRRPVVLSLVGSSDVIRFLGRKERILKTRLLNLVDAVVPNSGFYLDSSVHPRREQIIPYGVDLAAFRPDSGRDETRRELGFEPHHFVVAAVQRLAPLKRIDFLIEMLPDLIELVPEARLLVVGTGTDAKRLRQLARSMGLSSRVTFTGHIEHHKLPQLYAAGDAFASHSEFETFGITLVEAMAAGLPIVAADTTNISSTLEGSGAILVRPHSKLQFVAALARLARSPSLRSELGQAARAHAEKVFSWDVTAKSYEELFLELAGSQH